MTKKLETVFVFLKANIDKPDTISITHYDVRNICKILQNEKATCALRESFPLDTYDVPVEVLIDNLDKSNDFLNNMRYKDRPEKLIDRAIFAVESIDANWQGFENNSELLRMVNAADLVLRDLKLKLKV